MIDIPTPKNYSQYIYERNMRTMAVMSKQDRIPGRQIKAENLSVKLLTDAGYVHNSTNDTMERQR